MTPAALLDFLRRELAPTPGRGSATFRLTLACLAATIPILTHRIPHALVVMIMMYLITQEDTAAASRIDPGRDWGDHRSGAGPPRLEDFLGYHMAASQLHPCLYLRGFVSQARPDHRRARLRYRPAGSPHDDHSGYLATTARDTGLLHALDLVVRD